MILLLNRERMQAQPLLARDISFWKYMKQEWESRVHQNGTVLESGSLVSPHLPPVNCLGLPLKGRLPSEIGSERSQGSAWKRTIPPCRAPRSRMPRKPRQAHWTEPLPQKNRRPKDPGRGPRSCRSRKKRTTRLCSWRRQIGRRSRQSPEREWRVVPRPLAANLSPRPAKCRDHCGQSRPVYFRRQPGHPK